MSLKAVFLILVSTVAVIAIGAFLFGQADDKTAGVTTYSATQTEKPIALVKDTLFDFGKIKVNDVQTRDFTVKNIGKSALSLYGITSSCGCTTGKIIYQGQESREFGMHIKTDYVAKVDPETEATVRVTYRPFQMPVYGLVEREVYVSTNDPSNSKIIFKIKAYVE